MKLYLGSKHVQFPNALKQLVGVQPKKAIVRVSVNAFDNYPENRRLEHINTLVSSIEGVGYSCEMLDLREYANKKKKLREVLRGANLLWVSGGNVFYLRYVMELCGLDKILSDLLKNGLVYGGDSAGAAVLGPNMHGLDLLDDPAEAPVVLFEGLGITPFIVLPHWGNERYNNEIKDSYEELIEHNKEVVRISDSQACVVDGDSRKIHG